MAPRTAYLALGSNLGDRLGYLRGAVLGLAALDPELAVSPVYETTPAGGPSGQGRYLNCVVRLATDLEPYQLLDIAHELETKAARRRTVRNGPRTLDVDLLLYDDARIDNEDLVVPHPRMYERPFVLAPLEDLDPTLVPPGWREGFGGEEGLAADLRLVGTLPLTGG